MCSHVENVSQIVSGKVEAMFHCGSSGEVYRARQVGDIQAETRVWKAFGLVPMMLMRRRRGSGSIGRDEHYMLLRPIRPCYVGQLCQLHLYLQLTFKIGLLLQI